VSRPRLWGLLSAGALLASCAFLPTTPAGVQVTPVIPPGLPEGRLFRPTAPGPYPAVLLIHGGSWRSGGPWHMAPIGKALAAAGFLAFSTAYRFSPEHQHPAQEEDVQAALRWLAARDDVDASRLALWGYSAGAQLAMKTALETESHLPRLKAVVAGGTPGDFTLFDPESPTMRQFLGASRPEAAARWADASPLNSVHGAAPPTFFYHGADDTLVVPAHAERLHEALRNAGAESTLRFVPGGHMGVFILNRKIEEDAIAFLKGRLGS
jgi:acetyl esterase/lipase